MAVNRVERPDGSDQPALADAGRVSPMRIGYLVPEFPAQTHAFFWREVTALREMGHEVHLFSTTRPAHDASRHEFAATARRETTYLVPYSMRSAVGALSSLAPTGAAAATRYLAQCRPGSARELVRLTGIAQCAGYFTQEAARLDLQHLHVHSCADSAHLAAIQHLWGGIPFSLTLHGDLPVYGRNHHLKFADASFVSTVTRPLRTQVLEVLDRPDARVPVNWMGVDLTRFSPEERPVVRLPREPLRLVTVARLQYSKGHRFALQALRRIRDQGVEATYVIAGSGPERDSIAREIDELSLRDCVEMVGTLSEPEVAELLRASDVFLLPSIGLGEAAPVSVMEAMASGLPVISSIIGGTPDMITDGEDGLLVAQEDVSAIVSRILCLAGDVECRSRMGRQARRRAEAVFDFRTSARRLMTAIQESHRPGRA